MKCQYHECEARQQLELELSGAHDMKSVLEREAEEMRGIIRHMSGVMLEALSASDWKIEGRRIIEAEVGSWAGAPAIGIE